MKRILILLSSVCLLLTACHSDKVKQFKTYPASGEQCYMLLFEDNDFPMGDSISVSNSYSVVWPADGMMTPDAMRQLMFLYFGDSTAASAEEASSRWLEDTSLYTDWNAKILKVNSVDSSREYGYSHVEGTCRQDSTLATFLAKGEYFSPGAAHGIYTADYLTIDVETGNVVHLTDLVTDTNLLCEAIAHAIQDLEVNKDVRECLFDEFIDAQRMPLSQNFLIDNTRSCIIINYGLYEIACYACGIQSVTLPIFWLSKHVPLTPYAKRIFGPGCSLEDNE